jgi:hypothetical protein
VRREKGRRERAIASEAKSEGVRFERAPPKVARLGDARACLRQEPLGDELRAVGKDCDGAHALAVVSDDPVDRAKRGRERRRRETDRSSTRDDEPRVTFARRPEDVERQRPRPAHEPHHHAARNRSDGERRRRRVENAAHAGRERRHDLVSPRAQRNMLERAAAMAKLRNASREIDGEGEADERNE